MNSELEFPYPQLLDQLPRCSVLHYKNHYKIKPHKGVELLIIPKSNKNGSAGIYVLTKNGILTKELRKAISCCKEIHNFHDEKKPWLFIDEESATFKDDTRRLTEWVKSIK